MRGIITWINCSGMQYIQCVELYIHSLDQISRPFLVPVYNDPKWYKEHNGVVIDDSISYIA